VTLHDFAGFSHVFPPPRLSYFPAINAAHHRPFWRIKRSNELKAIRFKFYALTTGGIRGAYKNNNAFGRHCRGSVRFGGACRANGR
jgi:hypothetical protein